MSYRNPPRKSKKTTKRSKSSLQNYRSDRQNSYIPNQIYASAFPRAFKVKLKYIESISTATTNGLNFDRVFNLNSAFDPYRTGVGHQPRAFDQWALFYNRYRVDMVDVKVSYTNAPSDGAICSLLANNDATNLTSIDDIVEMPFSQWKPIQLGGPGVDLSAHYNLSAVTGVTKQHYEIDDRYSALTTADPAEILALHVGFNCKTAFTTNFYVVMHQYITFYDPIQIGSS